MTQSSVSWLAFSERERRQALDFIDLFRERETRDELGLGVIRDALADKMFPGISTIQTRARYFLLIPWVYLDLERRKVPAAKVADLARNDEIKLIEALKHGGEEQGVIGIQAGKTLRRLPSNIYWLGLETFGIRTFSEDQTEYHARFDTFRDRATRTVRTEDGDPVGAAASAWHAAIPKPPDHWREHLRFELTRPEAEYLHERMIFRAPGTLLSWLLQRGQAWEPTDFPWEMDALEELPGSIRRTVEHAQNVSETMLGAALLYNLMLSEKRGVEDWIRGYQEALADWTARMGDRAEALRNWDRRDLWLQVGPASHRTKRFVEGWLDISQVQSPEGVLSAEALIHCQPARELIEQRERRLKGKRARLDSAAALGLYSGAAGAGAINYRWPKAQRIVFDILEGLGEA